MSIPGQEVGINDPGMASSEPASMRPFIIGPSSAGDSAIHSISSPSDITATFGEGPMPELAGYVLKNGGGPVLALRCTASVAGSNSAVTKTAVASSTGTVTVAGTARDSYSVRVVITNTGTVGVGMFQYWLDGHTLCDEPITIPAGGTYVIPRTGLTLTFVPGAGSTYFEAGDVHTFTTTAASMNATDLASAFTTINASPYKWRFLAIANRPATAAAGATLFAALGTHMNSLETMFRFRRAMIDAGPHASASDDAAIVAAYAAQTHTRIMVCAGSMDVASAKPFSGWATPTQPILLAAARNATGPTSQGWGIPSTDLKRVRGGSIPGVISNADGSPAISHDEYKTETLDALGFTTTRTYPNGAAPYLTQGRLKCPSGSDYKWWQLGILMDIACETVVEQQAVWTGEDIRTNNDGSIDERDAGRIETQINKALNVQLLSKPRAGGQMGYVQSAEFHILRDVDVTDGYITAEVQLKAFVTINGFRTTLGYVQQLRVPVGQA